jgi:hypothetical protein
MKRQNKVFIATSLDGFIAEREGGIDWLHSIPNPEQKEMGYGAFFFRDRCLGDGAQYL